MSRNEKKITYNSKLLRLHGQIKSFSWESILTEFEQNAHTLILLLCYLMPKANGKFFIHYTIAVALKRHCKHMSLAQRVISAILYEKATQKEAHSYVGVLSINCYISLLLQVYKFLQPNTICTYICLQALLHPQFMKWLKIMMPKSRLTGINWSTRFKKHVRMLIV